MDHGATPVIHVAIVDDHPGMVDGYTARLERQNKIEVVGSAGFGSEIEPLLAAHPVDVLLLDVHVPTDPANPDPYPILHLVPKLLDKYPGLNILIISMIHTQSLIQELLDAGASGYILKNDRAANQALADVIRSVANGEIYLGEGVRQLLESHPLDDPSTRLTSRQLQALSLSAAHPGWTHTDLASAMSITGSTARNTLHGAYARLGVNNLAAALAKARSLGLITPAEPL